MFTPLPSAATATPPLVLCADGGGSKVMVVIRSADGIEVRGQAGPCNVVSTGHTVAVQRLLLATYRALALLPPTHLPHALRGRLPPAARLEAHSPPRPRSAAHPPPLRSVPATPAASRPGSPILLPQLSHPHQLPPGARLLQASRSGSESRASESCRGSDDLQPIEQGVFQVLWLGLAGISTDADGRAFMPHVKKWLGAGESNCKITNDVNLLAAPALDIPGVQHVLTVVCGTGTVGRTIRVQPAAEMAATKGKAKQLPLEDIAVSRGWGYMLCDEGSAFHLGRLSIRSLLFHADRLASSSIYTPSSPPPLLPLHADLLAYFGTADPMDLIEICSLTGPAADGLSTGEVTARRNAKVAGAARTVLRWAFEPPPPELDLDLERPAGNGQTHVTLNTVAGASANASKMVLDDPSPPSPDSLSSNSTDEREPAPKRVALTSAAYANGKTATTAKTTHSLPSSNVAPLSVTSPHHLHSTSAPCEASAHAASQALALKLARASIRPMVELTTELLGDGTVVRPETSVLALGGGLMMNPGYRQLLLDGLKAEGLQFKEERVVADAAGEGARGLASVEFGEVTEVSV